MTPQEKAKQQAEVMLAFANGAEIESTHFIDPIFMLDSDPQWDWSRKDYRVKKPAPKVVKLEAWVESNGRLHHYSNEHDQTYPPSWKRVPSLDLEYVEDES